ncbi:HET-domain-containing protein [Macroventuria anomochaeta]|uniref:HET-domain-containing protein n=1 Tax=Macroventuria anomochaeta TaxID=301207 RepID=A0ACB6RZ74_9PLEO|nr:HET-domain-containing protein [Macroventuria anomochaeta]KAF2627321.1 HET-domain-containing protein [Macroventuria anomochaeta]
MSKQQNDRYCYGPLPQGQYIRVLTLEPGDQDAYLSGELQVVHIQQIRQYEAVSYAWGEPDRCFQFGSSGGIIELTASLDGALRRIRHRDQPRRLWVDQLCINQDDKEERSAQVQYMNAIYKNAARVLVWLGNDPQREAKDSFDMIHDLDRIFRDPKQRQGFGIKYTEKLHEQSSEVWAPLEHLTIRPWFTRGWIVQEIGTKAPATLYWGGEQCDWELISGVVRELANFHHLRGRFDLKTSAIKYTYQRFIEPPKPSRHVNRFSLMYELQRARHCELSDPRDRVFMFLGHYSVRSGNQLLSEMQADYSKTVDEVYIDVAKRALLGDPEKSLVTLATVQHPSLPSNRGEAIENGLPSWVPDWRTSEGHLMSEPVSPHCAHGERTYQTQIDGNILSVRGIKVDILEACSGILRWKEFHYDPTRKDLAIESLWIDVCGQKSFSIEPRYMGDPNNEPALSAYLQTLSVGGIATALREGRLYQNIDQKELFAQGLAYLTRALGTSDLMAEEIHELAAEGDYHNWTRNADCAASNRAFARTKNGRYVLGPKVIEPGDVLCVLYGGKMPFVLRPWIDGGFLLVGECYAHGLMQGMAIAMMERGELCEETFRIH